MMRGGGRGRDEREEESWIWKIDIPPSRPPVDDAKEMAFPAIHRRKRNNSAPLEKKKTGGKIRDERERIDQGKWERMMRKGNEEREREWNRGEERGDDISSFRLVDNQRQ